MDINKIIEEQRKAFDNIIFPSKEDEDSIEHVDMRYSKFIKLPNKYLHQILQALKESEEKDKMSWEDDEPHIQIADGYNQAKSETIKKLKDIISSLK